MNPDLNDPIARDLSWSPVNEGGSESKTHKLIEDNVSLRFVPTIFSQVSAFIIIAIISFILLDARGNSDFLFKVFAFGVLCITLYAFYEIYRPRVFNIRDQIYRFSWLKPKLTIMQMDRRHHVGFSDIHAIQIIDEYIEDEDGDYTSTELNLVLNTKQRLNVVDHSDKTSIMIDAKRLARLLKVPIWYKDVAGAFKQLDYSTKE